MEGFDSLFARFRYTKQLRLAVDIVHSRRIGSRRSGVRTEYLGRLGALNLPEPIGLPERRRFWRELDAKFAAIEAKFPGRVTPADRRKILAVIEARIPAPTDIEEVEAAIRAANRQAVRKHAARTRQPEPA
jgi:hypothetical protein